MPGAAMMLLRCCLVACVETGSRPSRGGLAVVCLCVYRVVAVRVQFLYVQVDPGCPGVVFDCDGGRG